MKKAIISIALKKAINNMKNVIINITVKNVIIGTVVVVGGSAAVVSSSLILSKVFSKHENVQNTQGITSTISKDDEKDEQVFDENSIEEDSNDITEEENSVENSETINNNEISNNENESSDSSTDNNTDSNDTQDNDNSNSSNNSQDNNDTESDTNQEQPNIPSDDEDKNKFNLLYDELIKANNIFEYFLDITNEILDNY